MVDRLLLLGAGVGEKITGTREKTDWLHNAVQYKRIC